MATNKRTLSRIGFYCGLALFLIITLFPFFVMLMTSFKGAKEAISLHPTLLPQQWTLEHYVDIFNPMIFPFVDYFRNSLVVSVVSSVVAVFLGILGAYALSRLRFKGRMTINASFYTVYMFSGILLVVPLFKIITALGIYDTEMALIITMVTQTLPTAEVVDFRAASPFIDEDFNGEWQMFTPRPADAPRGIEFGKFQLGNMVVGDIIECGSDVTDYAVGDSVCGYGPLSETVIINAVNNYKLRKMPQGSSWKNAVCYDPAQFAMSGVRDANVRVGDFVVVVGLGAIGQIAIQLAKRAGASVVIGVDPIAYRCDIARRHGADFCLNPIGTDVGKEIKTLTGKQGADVIIETSGYADALQSALRGLAYGGTISYVAFAKPFAEGFNLGREAHFNNAKIVFSRACSEPNPDYPRWSRKRIEETCWELLMNGYLNCEDLIDPVVTFANSPESYMQYVDQHPEQSIKMGVTF